LSALIITKSLAKIKNISLDFVKRHLRYNFLVQVLPKGRFGEMISFEFHLKKWHEKTQKPFWFLGFPNRYLFRFALLSRSAEKDAHDFIIKMLFATAKRYIKTPFHYSPLLIASKKLLGRI